MRKILPLISTLFSLAAAAPAAAAEWTHPVSILSWKLAPGQPVACTGQPQRHRHERDVFVDARWVSDRRPATSSQYFLQFADEGHELRCRLTVETADGRLSGESAPLVAPVIDDGPPRVLHGAPLLMPGRGMMMGQWTSVPAAMRDWYGTGAPEVMLCQANPWAGVMGPTGAHWKFEFLREGAVVETMERDGDPMWQGSPAGWIGDNTAVARTRPVRRLARARPGRSRQALRMPADREQWLRHGDRHVAADEARQGRLHRGASDRRAASRDRAEERERRARRGSFEVGYAGRGNLKAKAGKHVVATGSAKRGKATLKLTAAGRKLLKRKQRLTVTVTAGGKTAKITLRA